jgi:uncharacterized protein
MAAAVRPLHHAPVPEGAGGTSGSVGTGTGWQPQHLWRAQDGEVIAVAPLYAKGHSQGEYIFDHNWAHAYERAGGRYYPKLQIAVPFTPATGRRFLTRPGWEGGGRRAWCRARCSWPATTACRRCMSPSAPRVRRAPGREMGLLHRTSQQFHWKNDGYPISTVPASLSSRKRKNIRKDARGAGLRRRDRA